LSSEEKISKTLLRVFIFHDNMTIVTLREEYVAEERISPPDETGWHELLDQRRVEFLDLGKFKIHFFEVRAYINLKSPYYFEGLVTMNFFKQGVVLKRYGVRVDESDERLNTYFLLLSDNCWIKGGLDVDYLAETVIENIDKEDIFRLTLRLRTRGGMKSRILRTKIRQV